MASAKDLSKILRHSIYLACASLLILEFMFQLVYGLTGRKVNYSLSGATKIDPITGWRGYYLRDEEKDPYNHIRLDQHQLIATPYGSSKKLKPNVFGILMLGNSGAMGMFASSNETSFAGQLELILHSANPDIDLVNASFHSYNSWMEHAELMRYLNTSWLFDDLPDTRMVISYGGVQDLWRLFYVLTQANNSSKYYKAAGLMTDINAIELTLETAQIQFGMPLEGFKLFVSSLQYYILRHSTFLDALKIFKRFIATTLHRKNSDSAPIKPTANNVVNVQCKIHEPGFSRPKDYQISPLDINSIPNKLSMSPRRYKQLRDIAVASVVRNVAASTAALGGAPFVYIYSPTTFSSTSLQTSTLDNHYIPGVGSFATKTIQLVERDFRLALLVELSKMPNVQLIDASSVFYSQNPDDLRPCFVDETHLSDAGSLLLARLISTKLLNVIKSID